MIKINNIKWDIKFVPLDSYLLSREDGSTAIGVCDDNLKTIFICNTLQGDFLKKVLCHEITHAAMFSYDVELTIDQEELIADLIATYGEEIVEITNKIFKKINKRHR